MLSWWCFGSLSATTWLVFRLRLPVNQGSTETSLAQITKIFDVTTRPIQVTTCPSPII